MYQLLPVLVKLVITTVKGDIEISSLDFRRRYSGVKAKELGRDSLFGQKARLWLMESRNRVARRLDFPLTLWPNNPIGKDALLSRQVR